MKKIKELANELNISETFGREILDKLKDIEDKSKKEVVNGKKIQKKTSSN